MSELLGTFRILYIKRDGDEWRQVAHLSSNSWDNSTEFANTTTRANAGFKTERPKLNSSSIDFSAYVFQDEDITSSKIGYKELKTIQRLRERFEWKLEYFNENFVDYGQGYFSNIGEVAEVGSVITFSGSINVYGDVVELGDNVVPTAPILILDNYGDDFVDLTWSGATDNIGVVSYDIRKTVQGFPSDVFSVGNVEEWTDNAVAQGRLYSYNVRAVDAVGNVSAWSNKVSIRIPIPSGLPDQTDALLYQSGIEIMTQRGQLIIKQ